jgi:hypothetical protein
VGPAIRLQGAGSWQILWHGARPHLLVGRIHGPGATPQASHFPYNVSS